MRSASPSCVRRVRRVVSTLWKGSDLPAGRNVAVWQPDPLLPSGAHFYRLAAGTVVRSGRVLLIR